MEIARALTALVSLVAAMTSGLGGGAVVDSASVASPVVTPLPTGAPVLPHVVLVRGGTVAPHLVESLRALPSAGQVSVVRAGQVLVPAEGGLVIPLEAIAVDPSSFAGLVPGGSGIEQLHPGSVLLGSTSARVRGLGVGGQLVLGDQTMPVAAVVDDAVVGGAEVVVHEVDAVALGVAAIRYVLVGAHGDEPTLRSGVEAVLAGRAGVLARDLGSSPWAVSWREVLPQALVKERFGEFAFRPGSGRDVDQQPGWREANVVTAAVPLLGQVTCHRGIIAPLDAALTEIEARGLGGLVDPGDYGGCFSPRLTGPGAPISRHAWGLALDINVSTNPFGAPSRQDERLVEVMERHDFSFGGRWPVPDAMHFEYRGQ